MTCVVNVVTNQMRSQLYMLVKKFSLTNSYMTETVAGRGFQSRLGLVDLISNTDTSVLTVTSYRHWQR